MATILHVDMDAFYAAVELLDHPEYQGRPLIIGGYKDSHRGVVSTCSYEARKYGVHSAMSIKRAVSLCPQGIFIPGRTERYQQVSREIHNLFTQFSPQVEPLSIDEAFLDMSGCEHFYRSLEKMGQAVKDRINQTTGLVASVGIAPNKFLAKLASDWKKPDGLMVIYPEQVDSFLLSLPVSKLWGVGEKTRRELQRHGIRTVKELRIYPQQWLEQQFGSLGNQLYYLARGIDKRKVEPMADVKSISQEQTFDTDYADRGFLKSQLALMAAKVGHRLRQQGLYTRTIGIKVRFSDFKTITRAHTLDYGVCDDDIIYKVGLQLLDAIPITLIRLLGIGAYNLSEIQQLSLFENTIETNELSTLIDKINQKFPNSPLTKGRTLYKKPKR